MATDNSGILRDLAEAFNARDFDRAHELVSPEIEFIDVAAGATVHGPDGFIGYARGWAGAFSDMTIETLAVVADERRAAGEFVGRGTHDGPLPTPAGEIPATGRSSRSASRGSARSPTANSPACATTTTPWR